TARTTRSCPWAAPARCSRRLVSPSACTCFPRRVTEDTETSSPPVTRDSYWISSTNISSGATADRRRRLGDPVPRNRLSGGRIIEGRNERRRIEGGAGEWYRCALG